MAENLTQVDPSLPKREFYSALIKSVATFLGDEKNLIAKMSTIAAILGETKKYLWAGFYIVDGDELVLGPFSGPLACFRIKKGRGVCGTAWAEQRSILVPNVNEFPGHIACSSLSNSEIVIPLRNPSDKRIVAVFDVDHVTLGGLDEVDLAQLEELMSVVSQQHPKFYPC